MSTVILPNLKATSDDVAPNVVVVGDPERADEAARHLSDGELVASNREFRLFTGVYRGTAVSVCSHGVGSAGAAVCFEELARGGATRVIRAGTCGGLQPGVQRGAMVLATGAVRDDGATERLVPLGFPAVADHQLTRALDAACAAAGVTPQRGLVCTSDLFYPSPVLGHQWDVWERAGVLALEMELATLLVVAALHRIAAAGILVADGNVLHADPPALTGRSGPGPTTAGGAGTGGTIMADYDPHHQLVAEAKEQMILITLEALAADPS